MSELVEDGATQGKAKGYMYKLHSIEFRNHNRDTSGDAPFPQKSWGKCCNKNITIFILHFTIVIKATPSTPFPLLLGNIAGRIMQNVKDQ